MARELALRWSWRWVQRLLQGGVGRGSPACAGATRPPCFVLACVGGPACNQYPSCRLVSLARGESRAPQ